MNRSLKHLALWLCLGVGIIYAALVSYRNFAGDSCPAVAGVPLCYIVLAAYALMVASLIVNHNGCKHYLFTAGWAVATVLAVIGSTAEFLTPGGGVCPSSSGAALGGASGGVPMCYVSLALLVVVLLLFLSGPYRAACDSHNADSSTPTT